MNSSLRKKYASGIASALVGGALWGFSGACSQYLFAHYDIDSSFITMARMLGSGVLFLVLLLATRRTQIAAMLADKKTLAGLAVFGVAGLFACQYTYISSIGATNAGTATVLQSLGTVWVMLASCLLARKAPRAGEAAGLVLALASTFIIATQGDPTSIALPAAGLFWGLANSVTVAIYIMFPKRLMARWGSLPVTGLGMLLGGVAALAFWAAPAACGAPLSVPALDAAGLVVLAAIAVLGTFAAFALYLHGVSVVGSVTGSLLGAIEPASATVIAALWLGTSFTGYDWAGFVLMVSMIVLVSIPGKKPRVRATSTGGADVHAAGEGKE